MGRGRSNDVTGDELVNALRTLTGLELDTMFEDGGKVDKILPAIERAFRVVDSGGLFKLSAMEDAFKVFDKSHKNKFSKASKQERSGYLGVQLPDGGPRPFSQGEQAHACSAHQRCSQSA